MKTTLWQRAKAVVSIATSTGTAKVVYGVELDEFTHILVLFKNGRLMSCTAYTSEAKAQAAAQAWLVYDDGIVMYVTEIKSKLEA